MVQRPNMQFVPIKNVEQQAILSVHRVRQGLIKARTAQANQIRGLLSEFRLVLPTRIRVVYQRVPALLDQTGDELPGFVSKVSVAFVGASAGFGSKCSYCRPGKQKCSNRLGLARA